MFSVRQIDIKTSSFGGQTFNVEGKIYEPRADYSADILAPEDISLCESVQRGLTSRSYDQGVFIVNSNNPGESEHALHHFHRLVQQALA